MLVAKKARRKRAFQWESEGSGERSPSVKKIRSERRGLDIWGQGLPKRSQKKINGQDTMCPQTRKKGESQKNSASAGGPEPKHYFTGAKLSQGTDRRIGEKAEKIWRSFIPPPKRERTGGKEAKE